MVSRKHLRELGFTTWDGDVAGIFQISRSWCKKGDAYIETKQGVLFIRRNCLFMTPPSLKVRPTTEWLSTFPFFVLDRMSYKSVYRLAQVCTTEGGWAASAWTANLLSNYEAVTWFGDTEPKCYSINTGFISAIYIEDKEGNRTDIYKSSQ